ncbi:MAG: NUMOD3 domain-containing DNA-binding protein [Patescibacteria group bacterium]
MPVGIYQHKPNQGFQKGYIPSEEHRKKLSQAHKGKKLSLEHIDKIRLKNIGRVAWNKGVEEGQGNAWKGDSVGYGGLHEWIRKHLGKANKCKNGCVSRKYEWANISQEYKRALTDFMSLCTSCHRKYDYQFERGLIYG